MSTSPLQKNTEKEEEDAEIYTIVNGNVQQKIKLGEKEASEDEDPLTQIMKKFRLDKDDHKVPKFDNEVDVESNLLFTIEDIKLAREAAEIRWKLKNSDAEFNKLKNHYMDYTIRNKIKNSEIAKHFDVKRMKLPRPVLSKPIYDDSELISKIEEVKAKYEKYKEENYNNLENQNEKENEKEEAEAEKMEIEPELPFNIIDTEEKEKLEFNLPGITIEPIDNLNTKNDNKAQSKEEEDEDDEGEMGIRISSNIFEEDLHEDSDNPHDNPPGETINKEGNTQNQQQQKQTYINLHDKQFPVTIMPIGGLSKNAQQPTAGATGILTPITLPLHMQSIPLNLLANQNITILPPQPEKSAAPSPASITISKPKQTAMNPQNLLKMLAKQNQQQMSNKKQMPQLSKAPTPHESILSSRARQLPQPHSSSSSSALNKALSNFELTIVEKEDDQEGTPKIINTIGNFVNFDANSKSQRKAEEESEAEKEKEVQPKEAVTISIVSDKTIPEFFVCRYCGRAFPLNSDHLFRSHVLIAHNLELGEQQILKSKARPVHVFKCLKCTSLVVYKFEEHSQICWNMRDKPFEDGYERINIGEHHKKPLKCGMCEIKSFETRIHLKQHLTDFHPELEGKVILDPSFRCGLCLKTFEEAIPLVRHVINCQKNGYKPTKETQNELARGLLNCDICQKEHRDLTESQNCYHQHNLIRCILCLYTVKTKSNFFHHIKSFHASKSDTKGISCFFCRSCPNGRVREVFEHILSTHYTLCIQTAMQNSINYSQKSNRFIHIMPKNNNQDTPPPGPPAISQIVPGSSGGSETFSIDSIQLPKSVTMTIASPSGSAASTTTANLLTISKSPVKTATATNTIPNTINLSQIHPSRIRQIRPGQGRQNLIFANPTISAAAAAATASGKYLVRPILLQKGTSATGFKLIPIGNKGSGNELQYEDNFTNAQPPPILRPMPMITTMRQRSPTMPTIVRVSSAATASSSGAGSGIRQQINFSPRTVKTYVPKFPSPLPINTFNNNSNVNVSMAVDGNVGEKGNKEEEEEGEEIIGI